MTKAKSIDDSAHAQQRASTMVMPRDPNTLSNYHNFRTTHISANLVIDFVNERLTGNVSLIIKSITEGESGEIVLDTSHLDIKHVQLDGAPVKWSLLARFEPYGSALKIELDKALSNGEIIELDVSLILREICIISTAFVDNYELDPIANH